MRLKRLLSLVAASVFALSLFACSSGGASSGAASGSVSVSAAAANQVPTIEETVLVDEAGVKITATSFDQKAALGSTVKLLIENNSGQDLIVQARNASINGYMMETMLSADVADGKKANDSLVFVRSDMKLAEIDTVASMEFSFHIFTKEGWSDYLDTAPITLETSVAPSYEYTCDDSGEKVFENNGITVIVKGFSEDASTLGPSVVVEVINSSDQNMVVQSRDVAVNGFMIDPVFSCDVAAGKRAIDTITFMKSSLTENNIQKIEEVSLSFHVFNWANWMESFDSEGVVLNF